MRKTISRRLIHTALFIAAAFCCISVALAQEGSQGKASYYSNKLHGRRMSNGERYHRDSMTCAHLKYPLGTKLKVKNPRNGKEVIVEVTDRGPHTKRFTIDLSYAAARALDIISSGFNMVEITPWHGDEIPYRTDKTEYDVSDPMYSATPTRTWDYPVWKKDSAEPTEPADLQSDDNQQ